MMYSKNAGMVALVASVLLAGTAETALGQQRAPRPRREVHAQDSMRNRVEPGRMDRNAGHPASAVLRLREQLQLNESQVQRLEDLRNQPLPQVSESALMRARADLMDATRGDGNPEAARAALERISRMHTDQQVARIRARKEAREVLTTEQKAQLDQMQSRFVDRRGDRVGPPNGRAQARPGRGMQGQHGARPARVVPPDAPKRGR